MQGDARAAKFTLRWPRRKPGAKEETPSPSHKGSAAQPLPTNSQQQQQEAPPPALPVPVAVRGGGRHRRRSAEAHAHSQQQEPDLALEMSAFTSPERGEELQPLQPLRHPLAAPPPPLPVRTIFHRHNVTCKPVTATPGLSCIYLLHQCDARVSIVCMRGVRVFKVGRLSLLAGESGGPNEGSGCSNHGAA